MPGRAVVGTRGLLAAVFWLAALLKAWSGGPVPGADLLPFHILDGPAGQAAVALTEAAVAALLLSRWWRPGLWLALLLALLFSGWFVVGLVRGSPGPADCGCLGAVPLPPLAHGLLLLAVGGVLADRDRQGA